MGNKKLYSTTTNNKTTTPGCLDDLRHRHQIKKWGKISPQNWGDGWRSVRVCSSVCPARRRIHGRNASKLLLTYLAHTSALSSTTLIVSITTAVPVRTHLSLATGRVLSNRVESLSQHTPTDSNNNSDNNMSSWGPKLEKKLNALADGASKESMQTLANWVGFNRKHAAVFSKTFSDALVGTTTETRQWLYWQVLSEVLLANGNDGNTEKWERASDLRTTLGEAAVVPALEGLGARALTDKIEGLLKQWDNSNVFGGPTLVGQIRRLLTSTTTTTSSATAARGKNSTEEAPAAPQAEAPATKIAPAETQESSPQKEDTAAGTTANTTATSSSSSPGKTSEPPEQSSATAASPIHRRNSSSSVGSGGKHHQHRNSVSSLTGVEIEYDFDSKNVPLGVVDSREFLDPCTAVATLQIARDVRNDASVQLNSLFINLPKDIVEKAESIQKGESKVEDLDAATIQDYSIRMPTELLELDLGEEYQSIITLQDIVRKQRAAREKLIYLLLKSRCQFGSQEAAKQFMELEATSQKLKKRKQLLIDALELEGLDADLADTTTDFEKSLKNLQPLTWYHQPPGESIGNTDAKRQRVD